MYYLFFFFSSRRRHTRWPRDWSSDVCSSDLARRVAAAEDVQRHVGALARMGVHPRQQRLAAQVGAELGDVVGEGVRGPRSEERRVGREWGGRGGRRGWTEEDE